jgi:hypothetical protein
LFEEKKLSNDLLMSNRFDEIVYHLFHSYILEKKVLMFSKLKIFLQDFFSTIKKKTTKKVLKKFS